MDFLHLGDSLKIRAALIGFLIGGGVFPRVLHDVPHRTEWSPITRRNPNLLPADEHLRDMKLFL